MSRSHIGVGSFSQECPFWDPGRQKTTHILRPETSHLRPGTRNLRNSSNKKHAKKTGPKNRKKNGFKKGVHMQSAHARQCLRGVRSCRRVVPGLTFGLHFGGILGSRFATILLSGRPGAAKGGQKGDEQKGLEKVHASRKTVTRGSAGMGGEGP